MKNRTQFARDRDAAARPHGPGRDLDPFQLFSFYQRYRYGTSAVVRCDKPSRWAIQPGSRGGPRSLWVRQKRLPRTPPRWCAKAPLTLRIMSPYHRRTSIHHGFRSDLCRLVYRSHGGREGSLLLSDPIRPTQYANQEISPCRTHRRCRPSSCGRPGCGWPTSEGQSALASE
jgi:hypothetical protein